MIWWAGVPAKEGKMKFWDEIQAVKGYLAAHDKVAVTYDDKGTPVHFSNGYFISHLIEAYEKRGLKLLEIIEETK
jgi:hypothetical protein